MGGSSGSSTPVAEPSMPSLSAQVPQVASATSGMLSAFNSMPQVLQNPANSFQAPAQQNPFAGAAASGAAPAAGGGGASVPTGSTGSQGSPITQAFQGSFNTSSGAGQPSSQGASQPNPIAQASQASGGSSGQTNNPDPNFQYGPMANYWMNQVNWTPAQANAAIAAAPYDGGQIGQDAEAQVLAGGQAMANEETPAFQQAAAAQAAYQPAGAAATPMGAAMSAPGSVGGTGGSMGTTGMNPFMMAMLQQQQQGASKPTAGAPSTAPMVQFM